MAQSEEESTLYRDIFEASRDPMMVHDAETGEILEANPAAGRMLGMDTSEVVGLKVGDFSPPSYSTAEANELIRTAAREGQEQVEWSVQGPSGQQRWVDVSLERAMIGGDERVVAYIRDVTEHKRTQQRYRTERDMLDRLLDVSPIGIVIHDSGGEILTTNEQAESILGVERGELVGSSAKPSQFGLRDLEGNRLDAEAAPFNVVARTGEEVTDRELTVEQPDGERVRISVSASPLFDDGELVRVVVSVEDVTKRRERQRRRAERANQLRTLVENLPVVVFTLDPEGIFTHSSGKGLETIGVEPGEFEGVSVYDVYREYDDITETVDRALDGEEVRVTQRIDGQVFETWYKPVFDDGELTQVVGVARDISEIEAQQAELERSNEALQQFAYIASHDLQEPLRMVSSYVDLLESEYGDQLDEEAREYMDFAVDGATRMKGMIDGLLSYSRVATQGSSFETVDANSVLEATLKELSLFLEERETTVEYDALPTLHADRSQLRQVFQNLIKNAAIHGDASTVEISAHTTDKGVEFIVADDGVGIPERQQEKIFDIFEQGTVAESGSGIGLAVCERIVHRHDGDIWVDSTESEGTEFTFTIPQTEGGENQ